MTKINIIYISKEKIFIFTNVFYRDIGQIYFDTEETAEKALEANK